MKATKLFEDLGHEWIVFGRDPEKPKGIIDTNQYMIKGRGSAMLLDPGGVELFAPMLAAVAQHVPISSIKHLFASHQEIGRAHV